MLDFTIYSLNINRGLSLFGSGELGPHLAQCGQGLQPFGQNTPTLQTDRTERRSDSIGRTALQTVAEKSYWQRRSGHVEVVRLSTVGAMLKLICSSPVDIVAYK